MKKPTIDLATPEDIDQIVALRQTCMPHVPTTRTLVEWQFFKNPLGTANVYVIRSDKGLVSMIATLPRPIRVNGEVRKGRTMVDIMTDPTYRGQGLAHQHGFRCWQDMTNADELAYILPNQNSERSVILSASTSESIFTPFFSMSTYTGVAPTERTASGTATHVNACRTTSSR